MRLLGESWTSSDPSPDISLNGDAFNREWDPIDGGGWWDWKRNNEKKLIDKICRGWVIFEVRNYRRGCLKLLYPYKIPENLPSDFSGVKKCLIFWWPQTLTSVWLNRRSSTFSRLRPHPRPSRGGYGRCGGSCSGSGSSCESYWSEKDGSLKKIPFKLSIFFLLLCDKDFPNRTYH